MSGFDHILALDTALNYCGVGVYALGRVISESMDMAQGHAGHLLPMAERVLKKSGIHYDELGAIAVTVGPGAFTGLRIGLSAARAMALALDLPLFGITTTQLLALQHVRQKPEKVMVVLETKRQDFYVQSFSADGSPLSDAAALEKDVIDPDDFTLIGDGVGRFMGGSNIFTAPDIGLMAELLATNPEYFTQGAEPIYLRPADVTASKRRNRVFEGVTGA
jgi:tRNA threonylcarbamoyl adenosine modification protein YeaZ